MISNLKWESDIQFESDLIGLRGEGGVEYKRQMEVILTKPTKPS